MSDRRLEGRVALVTGAASGNGRAIAARYAREGASVVGADVQDLPRELADADIAAVRCDVTSGDDVRAAVAAAVERFGRLDVAVANAGVNLGLHDLVDEPFDVYNASKGAVLQLVRTLAPQLAPHGITVNAICPGYVRTAMTAETQADPALLARALAAHPLGRLGEPDDVAGAAFFLASDDASWVTGIALPVDGGYTCV